MRPSAPSVMLSAIAALALCPPLAAQTGTPIDRGRAVEARFARGDSASGAGVSHTWEYARPVRRGTVLQVHVWGSVSELNRRLVPTVSISDPDAAADLSGTTRTEEYTDESITASKTFDRPGRVRITVSSGAGAAGRGYTLRVEDSRTRRSSTAGAHFAAGYGATTLKTKNAADTRGEGFTLRAGAGVSRALTVFAEGGTAEMSPPGSAPDTAAAYSYRMAQVELGARLYLLGSWSRLRPFVQGAVGGRWIELSDRPVQAGGMTLTPGGGAELFLRPGLSVEGGVRGSFGEITRWRPSGEKWRKIPDEYDLDARGTRAHLQLVVHL
ncbi:MAG TPA: hypothetical protein VF615_00250 [Longimicrobiaceae bacterium]